MTDLLLTTLAQRLDESTARFSELDAAYAGTRPLAFLAPEASTALGNRLASLSVNVPRLLVNAVAERLRVTGFSCADAEGLWAEWLANDLDQLAGVAHREALTLGTSYVIVWANPDGSPRVTVESPRQVAVLIDPGSRRVTAALKRWETATTTEAVLYERDVIIRYRSPNLGATTTGFRAVGTIPNPLGRPPVVQLRNGDRLLDDGVSEMADVLALSDALSKLTIDMLVASEYTARPRRWATGIELEESEETGEAVNPLPEGARALISENPEARFGQLAGSDLAGYETAIGTVMREISAVSGLPEHMLGIGGDNPTSADSIRASEAALTARAEARQATFGRAHEDVARLMVAVRNGTDPESVDVRVRWADAATRSVAQEADAVVKLYSAGLLPASTALARLGYSSDEIDTIRSARRAEALDGAGVQLDGLLP